MTNYDLYATYAMQFGLTFLPKGFNDASWAVATELMTRALAGMGPEVTHALINQHLKHHHPLKRPQHPKRRRMTVSTASRASSPDLDLCAAAVCPGI